MALTKVTGQVIKNTTDVTVGVLTVTNTLAVGGTVSIGGTLTYEDVTNVDAVGLITARNGIVVGSGITLSKDGDIFATGITTVSGNVKVGTGITLSPDGDVFFTGVGTGNGSGLTALNASNLASGTVPTARLGSGTASSSTFLRGDSTFQTVTTDLVADTSPQLGGALDTNSNNIDFGTNDKAIFGDNDQLKIYYDGSNSVVTASSNGDLTLISTYDDVLVQAADNIFIRPQGGEEGIKVMGDGAVELYNNNSKKFETTGSGVIVTGITTSQTFVPSEGQLANRNLVINGAMRVAQRATTYTGGYGTGVAGDYYKTVDRMFVYAANLPNTDVITSQVALTSGDAYDDGFRYAFQVRMGYQGSTPSNVKVSYQYRMEAQDIACSGWKHTSSSSYITLSFWVKSNVTQTFYGQLRTIDGTNYHYPFSYALTANTWKKVIVTVPGNSNLTINNDTGEGLRIDLSPYYGTDETDNSVSLNAWGTHSNSAKTPDQTATWYQTNGATFEVTGLQLEVGQTATPFEHKKFENDLAECQRYFETSYDHGTSVGTATYQGTVMFLSNRNSGTAHTMLRFITKKRGHPTVLAYDPTQANTQGMRDLDSNTTYNYTMNRIGQSGCTAYPTGSLSLGLFIQFHYTADSEL